MRNLVILLLVLIILGLYFYTDTTKDLIMVTGDFLKEKSKDVVNIVN